MPWGRYGFQSPSRSRQTGRRTGASFSGMQDVIRHAFTTQVTIQNGYTQCFNLVCYNPSLAGTPVAVDGSSTKTRPNAFTDYGSRVNNVAIDLTIKQTDTSKNNTCYTGLISTSFNEGQLSADLMETNFYDFIESNSDGEMKAANDEIAYNKVAYMLADIQQHNIQGLLKPAHHLYSGRVVTLNQNLRVPPKNRRQQNGSGLWLVIMNDSNPEGSDVDIRLDCFFKEIPSNAV